MQPEGMVDRQADEAFMLALRSFAPLRGESFTLEAFGRTFELVLDEVEGLRGGAREEGSFSLVFASDPGLYLPQASYPLHHPQLGTLEIFLVPIRPDERGSLFQAIFN